MLRAQIITTQSSRGYGQRFRVGMIRHLLKKEFKNAFAVRLQMRSYEV